MRRIATTLQRPAVYAPIVAALIATFVALITLDMIGMRWDVPITYNGDGLAVASHFKTVLETGWYEYQPDLGAPYGQHYHDYPTADNLHFMVAYLLGLIWPNWGVVMNVHFLLGFPLAAATATWLFRRLGISTPLTIALGVLYAVAPYHFIRSEGHLFLSWYWMIPLTIALILELLRGESVWGARAGMRRGLGHLTGRTGRTVAILAIVATSSAYYAVFTLILGGIAAIASVWMTRNWRRFVGALVAAGVTVVVLLINMAPDLLYRVLNGANAGALQRTPVESEIYALKLSQLLLPAPYHRFGPFQTLRSLYDQHFPLPSEYPALGLVGAVGLIALIIVGLYLVAWAGTRLGAREGRLTDRPSPIALRLAPLAFIALVAFLFSTVGGLSTLVSFATTALRSWNRMSIVIAVLALAAVGILLDAVLRRAAARLEGRRVALVALAVLPALLLGCFGVWDQTPPPATAARAATVASFDSDASFAAAVEDSAGADASVFELPYIAFPESAPVGTALDSDQLRLWLHSDLAISGGGIRGREDVDSLADVAALPPEEFVDAARDLGFSGVSFDTFAKQGPETIAAMQAVTGGEPIVSPDGRFVYLSF